MIRRIIGDHITEFLDESKRKKKRPNNHKSEKENHL
jgi:hypothetical protein